ncbi:MAG: hypothetical protein P1Q69_05190 [Candidatus Thorarchaeota archaeon]|nr:hypothetical protein [Candidatus Thorarchaeota archaeon]
MNKKLIPLMVLAGMLFLTCMPVADAQVLKVADVTYIQIIDVYYADLDDDGIEDDIKLLVEFSFPTDTVARVDLNIWIELPSGYTFNVRVSVLRAPGESILNIDCFNTAIESGWYTVTLLASVMGSGGGRYYIMDEIVFDPPKGGSGLPGVVAYF